MTIIAFIGSILSLFILIVCCSASSPPDDEIRDHISKEDEIQRKEYIRTHIICKKVKKDLNVHVPTVLKEDKEHNNDEYINIKFPIRSRLSSSIDSAIVDEEAQTSSSKYHPTNSDDKSEVHLHSCEQEQEEIRASYNQCYQNINSDDDESIVSFSMNNEETTERSVKNDNVVAVLVPSNNQKSSSSRHSNSSSSRSTSVSDDKTLLDSIRKKNGRKGTIYLRTSGSIRSSLFRHDSSYSSLYSPKSCSICFENYKIGDNICWSRNDSCPHAFHQECLTTWLLGHNDCPLCREHYL